MIVTRWLTHLRRIGARLQAKYSPVSIYSPLDRPRWPVDRDLISRQLRAAAKLGENSIKPIQRKERPI